MFYRNTAIDELFNSLAILDSNKYNRRSRQYQTDKNDEVNLFFFIGTTPQKPITFSYLFNEN